MSLRKPKKKKANSTHTFTLTWRAYWAQKSGSVLILIVPAYVRHRALELSVNGTRLEGSTITLAIVIPFSELF